MDGQPGSSARAGGRAGGRGSVSYSSTSKLPPFVLLLQKSENRSANDPASCHVLLELLSAVDLELDEGGAAVARGTLPGQLAVAGARSAAAAKANASFIINWAATSNERCAL